MTDEQVVSLFLRVQHDYAFQNGDDTAAWLVGYARERITTEQFRRALDLLRRKWEQSLAFDDLLVRVARLETERNG